MDIRKTNFIPRTLFCFMLFFAPATPGESIAADDAFQLPPIIVTARKKEEDKQKVPVSMDVFSQKEMGNAGITDTPAMVRASANVSMMERSCEHIVVIRGISPFRGTTYSNAGFYVDDVSYPLHYSQNIDFFDLERVEILKGPQGTLYGRNAESGVINILTRQPGNEFSSRVLVESGTYNTFRSIATIDGPVVGDTFFMKGAVQYSASDGYVENKSNGNKQAADLEHTAGRATMRWTPSPQWDVSFIADIMTADDHGAEGRFLTGPRATAPHKIRRDTDAYLEQDWNSQVLRMTYESGSLRFLSVTGLLSQELSKVNDCDLWDDPADRKINPTYMKNRQYSQEFRVSSRTGPVEWLAGLYGFIEDAHFDYKYEILSAGMTYMNPVTDIDAAGAAVFGQGTYAFSERLRLTAGLRLDHEDMTGDLEDTVQNKAYRKDLSHVETMPKVSLAWDVFEDAMAYAVVSRGYLAGGYNWGMTGAREIFSYDPEYTWNYETGVKTAWLGGIVTANLSLFYISIDDKQVSELHPTVAMTTITNAAAAHSHGIELDVSAMPFKDVQLSAGLGWNEAEFDRFTARVWNEAGTGLTLKDYGGNRLPYAPEYTFHISAQYRRQIGFYLRAELMGTGSFYGDAANEAKQKAYEIANLRLGYAWDKVDLSFYAENLFDEQYCTFLSVFQQSIVGIDGPSRTFHAKVAWQF